MKNKRNSADVYLRDTKAALLEKNNRGYRFSYHEDYLSLPDAQPVSLTLPLADKPYESESLFPFFLGLIPEGWLLDITSRTLKIDPENVFDILLATCGDCIGAVKIIPL
ncbi:serine/threonine-protein kinase HipA [Desulfosarcina sp. BuS5]|uniref:HipA N-terminal domain-containing protein n=1 Tax=Desulfosarcina sp. BuS5 TaxID=933262 RepID=UPI000484C679|nr:HipA N-terminal domain-containing protein [Desulfosarcina sp. BuS5]WDN87892.1 serine/threonine-protein kinase HipA [Desulfosarcina sp. BuS5]